MRPLRKLETPSADRDPRRSSGPPPWLKAPSRPFGCPRSAAGAVAASGQIARRAALCVYRDTALAGGPSLRKVASAHVGAPCGKPWACPASSRGARGSASPGKPPLGKPLGGPPPGKPPPGKPPPGKLGIGGGPRKARKCRSACGRQDRNGQGH